MSMINSCCLEQRYLAEGPWKKVDGQSGINYPHLPWLTKLDWKLLEWNFDWTETSHLEIQHQLNTS